jgi:uncharacterized SAM-binding protein YcdF (DUF218 family)
VDVKTLAGILLLVVLWGVGLMAFAARVANSTPAPDPQASDGIVSLTGASTVRIASAVQLLERGKAKRLLISGVNPEVSRADMQNLTHDYSKTFDCCVDLGFRAADTQGNARETLAWTHYHHFKTVIVVTADFHMPRAMLELKAATPGVTLRPYPVATQTLDAHRWWKTTGGSKRMAYEYCKYLVILAREAVLHLGAKRDTLVVDDPANNTTSAPATTS